jgi:hypothetical protein
LHGQVPDGARLKKLERSVCDLQTPFRTPFERRPYPMETLAQPERQAQSWKAGTTVEERRFSAAFGGYRPTGFSPRGWFRRDDARIATTWAEARTISAC